MLSTGFKTGLKQGPLFRSSHSLPLHGLFGHMLNTSIKSNNIPSLSKNIHTTSKGFNSRLSRGFPPIFLCFVQQNRCFTSQKRFGGRRQSKKQTQTQYYEPESKQEQTSLVEQEKPKSSWLDIFRTQGQTVPQERQIESLQDKGLVQHLRQVYLLMGSALGLSAVGSLLSIFTPLAAIPAIVPGLAALVPLFWLYTTHHSTHSESLRVGLFSTFSILAGMSIAPLIKASLFVNPLLVPAALGLSAGLFGAITLASLYAPQKSFLKLGAPLFGGAILLLGVSIAAMLVPVTSVWYPILHNVWLYGGLALFSVFVAFDTHSIIDDYERGEHDVLKHAINMFINFKGIFVRILYLLMGRDE